jgi:uncharacterized membrane protein
MYRFLFTHSLWLIALTITDVVVAFLIWREYQARKQSSTAAHMMP